MNVKARKEAEIQALWDSNAAAWISGVRQGYDKFRRPFHDPVFFELVGDVAGQRIIDLGCGEGITCRALAERGAGRVVGLDISPVMIEAALEAPSSGIVEFVTGSFSDSPALPDCEFDIAVSVMALMDAPDLDGAIRTAARVLRPGGILVYSVAHPLWDKSDTDWKQDGNGAWRVSPGDYFATQPWTDSWSFSLPDGAPAQSNPFSILNYPRTVSDYLNSVTDAGFRLENVVEPRAPATGDAGLDDAFERWRHFPFYLMVRARLP